MHDFASLFQRIVLFQKNKHLLHEEKILQTVHKQFKTESIYALDACDWTFSKYLSDIYPELPKKQMRADECSVGHWIRFKSTQNVQFRNKFCNPFMSRNCIGMFATQTAAYKQVVSSNELLNNSGLPISDIRHLDFFLLLNANHTLCSFGSSLYILLWTWLLKSMCKLNIKQCLS